MPQEDLARPSGTGSHASHEAPEGLRPAGFDPARDVLAISSSACFFPEEDEPERFDGSTILWTFEVPKSAQTGAGVYRLQFVRTLTPEERGDRAKWLKSLRDSDGSPEGEKPQALSAQHDSAAIAQKALGD